MSEPEIRLSALGERVARALAPRFPPCPSLVVGLGAIWIVWGWRAALGVVGGYWLAIAWKRVSP